MMINTTTTSPSLETNTTTNSLPATLPELMELQRTYKRLYKADSNLVAISEDNVHVRPDGLVSIIKYLRPDLNLNADTNLDINLDTDPDSDTVFTVSPDPDFTFRCELRPDGSLWVYRFVLIYKDVKFIALVTKEEYNEFKNNWR